ncbi:MAG: type I-U CRISPR-associated helicase/endonuclease Cas3 [Bryobacteraceae bacterium]
MTPDLFSQFCEEVHGHRPFRWQQRLLAQVLAEGWPRAIAMPTSAGKTSILDLAVFLLALEADLAPESRKAALRTFLVIDRRVVVDQAFEHAHKLEQALAARNGDATRQVADRLAKISGGSAPLKAVQLRGGITQDKSWIDAPTRPLLCVSTVDQFGSRLLFRGYGVTERQRPVHAALTGMDSLLIVDEAHLSQPFRDTVEAMQRFQEKCQRSVGPGLRMVEMTATPRSSERVFGLDDSEDLKDKPLADRWSASKVALLREPQKLEEEAVRLARQFRREDGAKVIGIVVNRVDSAREIWRQLSEKRKDGEEAILLTGRTREHDRTALMEQWLEHIRAKRSRENGKPVYVVSTQTIEVGADLDFDALITEAAPIDALQQRFGRLDRLGQSGASKGAVLLRKGTEEKDPIYGSKLGETWKWLRDNAEDAGAERALDFGVLALRGKLTAEDRRRLGAESEGGPILFPAHVETWVQTNPTPDPDPDVAPFLHGRDAMNVADVQIVWRADLDETNPDEWAATVKAAPISSGEALPLPIGTAKAWLAEKKPGVVADLEGRAGESSEEEAKERPFLVWMGVDRTEFGDRLFPGATIVVPASYGGCDDFGWDPKSKTPAKDIGDECWNKRAEQGRAKPRQRMHPNLGHAELVATAQGLTEAEDPDEIRELFARFSGYSKFKWQAYPGGFVIEGSRIKMAPPDEEPFEFEGEDGGAFTGSGSLEGHTTLVEMVARTFGRVLPEDLRADVELAARFHDTGKLDSRFQAWLRGQRADSGDKAPLAKSEKDVSNFERTRLRKLAEYPENARHEFVSVALIDSNGALAKARDPELVRHLIGSHHGWGRPFAPVWNDGEPERIEAEFRDALLNADTAPKLHRIDSGWADQFWRLVDRYGAWGLAYLETVLRRADSVASIQEDNDG